MEKVGRRSKHFPISVKQISTRLSPPVTSSNIHGCCSCVLSRAFAPNTTKKRGSAPRRCARWGTAGWGEGGNNSFVGGIRRAEEEGAEDEERARGCRGGLAARIDERERTERNFAFNQPSNETAREGERKRDTRWLASQREEKRGG